MEFFFLFFFFSAHPHGAGFTNPIAGLGILPVWNNVKICTGGGMGERGVVVVVVGYIVICIGSIPVTVCIVYDMPPYSLTKWGER